MFFRRNPAAVVGQSIATLSMIRPSTMQRLQSFLRRWAGAAGFGLPAKSRDLPVTYGWRGLEALEPRVMMSADLQGLSMNISQTAAMWGQTVSVAPAAIRNAGTTATGAFQVQWYLSQDGLGSAGDVLLQRSTGTWSFSHAGIAGTTNGPNFSLNLILPGSRPSGWTGTNFFVVMKSDSANQVAESNEANNFGQIGSLQDSDALAITANDPNDQMSEAAVVSTNSTTLGEITAGADYGPDVDMVQFTVAAGQTVNFDVDRTSGTPLTNSYLRLFNSSGTQLAANNDGAAPGEVASTDSFLSFTFSAAGTYFVAVSGAPNSAYNPTTGAGDVAGATGQYLLILTSPATDPNDQISEAAATSIGASEFGEITAGAPYGVDVDMFSISVAAGQTVEFDVDANFSGGLTDSYLRLFNSAGTQLAANNNGAAPGEGASNESFLSYTFGAAGTYYVGVSGNPNSGYNATTGAGDVAGATGQYFLRLNTPAPPANDPDDQISEALSLPVGSTVFTDIASGASYGPDVDMYKFTAAAGQTVQFDVDTNFSSGLTDSYLRIFNGAGAQLTANDNGAAPGEGASTESFISYTFATAGTYYVGVSGTPNTGYNATTGAGDVAGATGFYYLTLAAPPPPPADPNDQISEAAATSIGSTEFGDITAGAPYGVDVDMFSFTVAAGQTVQFDVDTNFGGGLTNSYLRLFNSAGTQLAANNDGAAPGEGASTESFISYTFATAGTYYVGVSGNPNSAYNATTGAGDVAGATGQYNLTLSLPAPPPGDPNDQISEAAATPINSSQFGEITAGAPYGVDVDMFSFTVSAGQTVQFDVDRTSSGGLTDSYLRLFNSAGTQLAANNNAAAPGETASADSYLTYTFSTAGTYYVGVSGNPNTGYNAVTGAGDAAGATGQYYLTLTTPPPPANDPDDQISEAIAVPVGATVLTNIASGAAYGPDVDMFKVTVSAGKTINFDLDTVSGGLGDSYLRLFNSAGTQLAANNDGTAPGEGSSADSFIAYTFATAGTYYVAVSGNPNTSYNPTTGAGDLAGSTGQYYLRITDAASMSSFSSTSTKSLSVDSRTWIRVSSLSGGNGISLSGSLFDIIFGQSGGGSTIFLWDLTGQKWCHKTI